MAMLMVKLRAHQRRAVGSRDHAGHDVALGRWLAKHADGDVASSAKSGQRHAFDGHGKTGGRIVEKCNSRCRCRIAGTYFDGKRTLPGRGTQHQRGKPFADPLCSTEALQSGSGKDHGIDLTFAQLAQSRIDIAAKLDELNIMPLRAKLRLPPQTAGADLCATRKSRKGFVLDGNKRVARIDPRWNGGNGKLRSKLGRKVFQTMDGKVDPVRKKGFFNLLGEHPLGIHLIERQMLHCVAGCADDLNRDLMPCSAQCIGNMVCLPERKLRASGTDPDHECRPFCSPAVTASAGASAVCVSATGRGVDCSSVCSGACVWVCFWVC